MHNTIVLDARSIQMLPQLTCLAVNLLVSVYYNFDTIVLQTVLSEDVLSREEIVTQCLIGQWKERRETEGDTALGFEDEQPKRTLLTHLSVTLSFPGRWSHLLMSSFTQYH